MISSVTADLLSARDRTTVFPSEVAAAFWRREFLRSTGRSSIRADRILSWDAFKERFFGRRLDLRPVNTLRRTIFALSFLEDHRRRPRLTHLVPPKYADESPRFMATIRAVLPLLPVLQERAGAADLTDLSGDLSVVRRAYDEFLADAGCFEPSWVGVGEVTVQTPHTIVFPELLEDFPEFRTALEASPAVSFVHTPSGPAMMPMIRFTDTRREVDALFDELETLLDAGTAPAAIAVTIPRVEEIEEILTQESDRRQVPLVLRTGSALSDFPPGRLLASIAACDRSRFSLESMKRLLLDRGVPWRDRRMNELLVRFGVDAGCLANGRDDAWGRAFAMKSDRLLADEVRARRTDLADYYRSLSRSIRSITRSSDFSEIKRLLYIFLNTFLDTDRWDATSERVFQRSIEVLDDLAEAAAAVPIRDPFSVYLRILSETTYVTRRDTGGINVYPHRVSAGIEPAHHFIVNASRRTTEVRIDPFPFLSDPLRDALGVSPEDATEAFWSVYERSGTRVHASYAEVSAVGPELPPGRFVAARDALHDGEVCESRFRIEERWWRGESAAVSTVYPVQQGGFERALSTAFRRRGVDLTESPLSHAGLIKHAVAAQSKEEEPAILRISPTHLEAFAACPFSYFFNRVMGLEELSWTADPERPQDVGNLYHRVLELFFSDLKERAEPLLPDRAEAYERLLREILRRATGGYAERYTALHPVALAARRERIAEDLVALLHRQLERLSGMAVAATERWFDTLLDGRVHLYGKVDRVDTDPSTGGARILDYKKRGLPSASEVTGRKRNGDATEVTSFQIPFYLFLAEENGISVDEAGYESVEDRRYKPVFASGKGRYFSPDERETVEMRLLQTVRSMTARIRNGDYRCRREDCDGCAFRALCRGKFVVEVTRRDWSV